MKSIQLSFYHMLKMMRRDMMLMMAGVGPVLAGLAIHFGLPICEQQFLLWTKRQAVLAPYYSLFDLFLAFLIPVMFGYIVAMVMLEEHDDHIDTYLFITGLGKKGYYLSRIGITALLAFILTFVMLPIFSLTDLSQEEVIFLSGAGMLQGLICTLIIVCFATNKLEGMALSKLSAVLLLGAIVPYVLPLSQGYVVAFLPSFWIGVAIRQHVLPAQFLALGLEVLVLSFLFFKLRQR